MKTNYILILIIFLIAVNACITKNKGQKALTQTNSPGRFGQPHKLQFHFSPDSMWMNDPNGMVYLDGSYHLFYQHHPYSNVWGPMHWGHAISKDLLHWKHLPIALYPDSLGYIFSGSAVYDSTNTSNFGTKENPPLVSIFTYHNSKEEKAGKIDFQSQGIAYSLDQGITWKKYKNNPVLKNPGIKDFRDPKVFWYAAGSKWIMILAVKDRVHLYSSPDCKQWKKESEFGKNKGAHGGVWECPDLFPLTGEDKVTKWVMLVSINPGGPNGGSATQYFTGQFDGKKFTCEHEDTRWIDYGPDNYAGVTWSNVKNRKLFLGWMNNWDYANEVPTSNWRGAATVPRELALADCNGKSYIVSKPVKELNKNVWKQKLTIIDRLDLTIQSNLKSPLFDLSFTAEDTSFEIQLSNSREEFLLVGYEANNKEFYIDRRQAGINDFSKNFARRAVAKRVENGAVKFRMLVDVGSIEVFADRGEVVMTSLFFPTELFSKVELVMEGRHKIWDFSIAEMKPVF